MGMRRRVRTLESKNAYPLLTLVCPECSEEFSARGDVAIELVLANWRLRSPSGEYGRTPEEISLIIEHEHDPDAFIDKRSGLPFRDACGLQFGRSSWGALGGGDAGYEDL